MSTYLTGGRGTNCDRKLVCWAGEIANSPDAVIHRVKA